LFRTEAAAFDENVSSRERSDARTAVMAFQGLAETPIDSVDSFMDARNGRGNRGRLTI